MNRIANILKILALIVIVLINSQGVFADGVQKFDATRVRLLPGSTLYEIQELHRQGNLASFDPDSLLSSKR